MDEVVPNVIAVGDKIELHTAKGPEGGTNQGLVKSIKKNGVVCDFGLNYTYAIPYSAIHSHFKKSTAKLFEWDNETSKTNSKNNNLQNILS